MFGSPMSMKKSGVITANRQGQQIFEDIVDDHPVPSNWPPQLGNWSSDWTQYNASSLNMLGHSSATSTGFKPYLNWNIPPSTLSYTDKTDSDIMKDLTAAIGAYIQTDPYDNVFHVKPIRAQQPWNWNKDNDRIQWKPIIEDQCTEISRQYELNPYYQRVHVIGEAVASNSLNSGPDANGEATFVNVYRDGWPNGDMAPMITNPLITTNMSAIENGRMVIGKVGEWVQHTLRLSVLCPAPSPMGLFYVGDMITVFERGLPWYGQVTSINVTAGSNGAGFSVIQTMTVEEYIGA
jgi:hypothetical protein